MSNDWVLLTDIGGDVDDALAVLLMAGMHKKKMGKLLAVMTTHIEPVEKAKIAKAILTEAGLADIPVYAGVGCARNDDRQVFFDQNPLFPPKYGFPQGESGEKTWHPKQSLAYREVLGDRFDKGIIEKEKAGIALAKLAKKYSPENPLTVIAIGPLHDLDAALTHDPEIAKNIRVVSMGGLYPNGYNWLISPQVTARVLAQVKVTCITAEFIRDKGFSISGEQLKELKANAKSDLSKAIFADWDNWHEARVKRRDETDLYDPTTACIAALFLDDITKATTKEVSFPCIDAQGNLKPEFIGIDYTHKGLEDKIVLGRDCDSGNVTVVEEVKSPELIRDFIVQCITEVLGIVVENMNSLFSSNVTFFKKVKEEALTEPTVTNGSTLLEYNG